MCCKENEKSTFGNLETFDVDLPGLDSGQSGVLLISVQGLKHVHVAGSYNVVIITSYNYMQVFQHHVGTSTYNVFFQKFRI